MSKPKCVMVIGQHSTGSKLIAKTVAHVLGVADYETWNARRWARSQYTKGNNVFHLSIPSLREARHFYKGPRVWKKQFANHDLYILIPTRDQTCIDISSFRRWKISDEERQWRVDRGREMIKELLTSDVKSMVWSYETFLYLGDIYLQTLWSFLGIESNFVPDLIDGNKKYIKGETNG